MTSLWTDHSIDAGCFINPVGVLLSLSTDALSKEELVHSRLVLYATSNGAVRELAICPWKVVSMARHVQGAAKQGLALGEDGHLLALTPAGTSDWSLGTQAGNPAPRGPLRKVRSVGGVPLVVGMNRQVYAIEAGGRWRDLSPPAPGTPLGGFEGVAGLDANDFVCAGWRGELWRWRGGTWHTIDSPTNVLITDIAARADGSYVACGLSGLVLVGRDDEWRVLDQKPFDLNLYSVAEHEGRVYLASMYGLYELKDETLYDVRYGPTPPPVTAHTAQSIQPGALGLIGAKSLYVREGDSIWHRYE